MAARFVILLPGIIQAERKFAIKNQQPARLTDIRATLIAQIAAKSANQEAPFTAPGINMIILVTKLATYAALCAK